jgi:CCR4-NOT transcription complex subunit 9
VLDIMVDSQTKSEKPSTRLLKHIIKCYIRLAENQRAQMALSQNHPGILKQRHVLDKILDENSKRQLRALVDALSREDQE